MFLLYVCEICMVVRWTIPLCFESLEVHSFCHFFVINLVGISRVFSDQCPVQFGPVNAIRGRTIKDCYLIGFSGRHL